MKYSKFIIFIFIVLCACNQDNKEIKKGKSNLLKEGYWNGDFLIQNHHIPIMFHIDSDQKIVVYNGNNHLEMKEIQVKNDSVKVDFNDFPNYLKFKINSKKQLTGYFVNPDHKEPKIDFQAKYVSDTLFNLFKNSNQIDDVLGKWEVKFRSDTDHPYFAIGQFYKDKNSVKGTFLKNSGDEGFLNGTFNNDTLKLYTFNGSSAGVFIAELKDDTLNGLVLSGNSGKTHWKGYRNDDFQLADKDSITYLVKDSLHLNFKKLNGEDFTFPNKQLKDKVVIFQIMGTWCPNCLDETHFLKELYKKYHTDGLEIIGIAYERPITFENQSKRVQRYIDNEKISYPILIGGSVTNNKVLEDFSMFNDIVAFPTAIYINKEGEVAKIYTGFSGPGTGTFYEEYKKETIEFIENLLYK